MSNNNLARRTSVKLYFDNVDITNDINKSFKSLKYTDCETGETDDLQIELDDRDHKWVGEWLNTEIERRGTANVTTITTNSSHTVVCPYAEPTSSIRYGAKGDGASWVQWHLIELGYGIGSSGIDGSYGPDTRSAIRRFQTDKGLSVDGICGPKTRAALKSALEEKNAAATTATAVVEGTASKKAELHAVICRQNWNGDGKDDVLDCGVFELDTVTLAGPPNTLNLQGTSISYESGIRQTKKSRAWENMNLSAIASKIAAEGGYGISYISGFNPFYGRREQVDQPDISFLHELCRAAGISLKSTSKTLVLFDAAEFERADPVRTIKYGDKSYISYDFTTTLANTAYSACTVSYTPPGEEDSIDVTFNNPNMAYDENNVLKVSDEAVTSESEAYDLAWRRLRQANKGETTAQFTLPGDTSLVAGLTVQVSGFGAFDNKYIIETAEHSVKESYQLSLDLRQVLTGY